MNNLQRKTIVLDGVRIEYLEREREAPAILLLHGFASGSYVWKSFAEKIQERFRILIPDLPGHGSSGLADGLPTLDFLVNWVEKFRLITGMNRFAAVGHSMGAAILGSYSVKFSDRLTALVLESPPDDRSRIPFFWKLISVPAVGNFLMN